MNCDFGNAYDSPTDGAIAISGRKFFFGPEGAAGTQFPDGSGNATCQPIFRQDSSNLAFSAGPTSPSSLRYRYDVTDSFRILGNPTTLDQFRSSLTAVNNGTGDRVTITYFPGGTSQFNICVDRGADAPNDLTGAVGSFDGGLVADDARLQFTSPNANTILSFSVQRASVGAGPASSANCTAGASANPNGSGTPPPHDGSLGTPNSSQFATIGTVSTPGVGELATFTDSNVAFGGYCYRVAVTNPVTGVNSYSNYVPANIPGTADTTPPTSTSARLNSSSGFANTLDTGDQLVIDFSEPLILAANASIRVTDSDCGQATNAGPAPCSGGQSNTVVEILCGTNANCFLQSGPGGAQTEIFVILQSLPSVVVAGSTPGPQFAVVVTASTGITDLSNNPWNLAGSPDRVMGPNVGQ